MSSALSPFSPPTRTWFERAFQAPTPVQERGWAAIASGEHALLIAPTGSGKTLAAFLWAIDRLGALPPDAAPGVRVLYISPLKALAYDVERNLRAPLIGVQRTAEILGGTPLHPIRISTRTGDTPAQERRLFLRHPGEILITTPESLFLLLGSSAREHLKTVETVIVDEVHSFAGSKRGVHLTLSLERLAIITEKEPQRVALSATVRPAERIAAFLGGRTDAGPRHVQIVDAGAAPNVDLEVIVPVADMEVPVEEPPKDDFLGELRPRRQQLPSIWPAIHPRILKLIREHDTTIVFVNSRLLCERLAAKLNALAAEEAEAAGEEPPGELVKAHHGSIAHEHRKEIEEALKAGKLKAIVATSSLELGIDMGSVDLVVQVESPGSVARGLQRVGRAGHGVGQRSIGRIFPKYRGDLLEAAVVTHEMLSGHIEEIVPPKNCLDVLAQQIVSMCAERPWGLTELETVVRRAAPYHGLSRDALVSVLDMLAGRYPSSLEADLRPRIVWDRETDQLRARRGSGLVALVNAGTIPDRGLYGVFIAPDGPRIGELDEEMVFETRKADNIVLGASTWKVEEITRDRVLVTPAPGEPGRLPFWRGDGPGRPLELGRAVGRFTAEVARRDDDDARAWMKEHSPLDALAIENLLAFVKEQREATGTVPSDEAIVVERFQDELGDWRICILSPFGGRVHAPWALALEASLKEKHNLDAQVVNTDDGLVVRFADAEVDTSERGASADLFFPDPDDVEEMVMTALRDSSLFAAKFREAAARALLLPKRQAGARSPLWAQRRSEKLLSAVGGFASFPIVLEAFREALQDVFDLPALMEVLRGVRDRSIRVVDVETKGPSPFARSLVFAYVANFLYEGDTVPLAERRALALTLDKALLRDLLGQDELRNLLDADVLAELEAELLWLDPERRITHADRLKDLLVAVGPLTEEEIARRADEPVSPWLRSLKEERQIVEMRIVGEKRWVAIEDVAVYRDALGAVPPAGLPQVFLEHTIDPVGRLVERYARTHGPFKLADVAAAFALPEGQVLPVLTLLHVKGTLEHGEMRPGGAGMEWCHTDVLRLARRRTLAKLRGEVAAVDPEVLGRFLPAWHGIGSTRKGTGRLIEVVTQLEGLPIPWSDLEEQVLPARVKDYHPGLLDELGARGEIAWVGMGPLGPKDGKVALYRRERLPLLSASVEDVPHEPEHEAILALLRSRGAVFEFEIRAALPASTQDEVKAFLWDLVWSGVVTNDTFVPLRSLGARRMARTNRAAIAGGRWSLLETPFAKPSETERLHARATMLLERYGVVSRAVLSHENVPGGFQALYPILRAMEEAGKVRRGHFVAGLGGAQFALPGVVDRLRAHKEGEAVVVLAAADPANPYGTLLAWPEPAEGTGALRRVKGADVILVGGVPALYLERHRAVTFPALELHGPAVVEALKVHFAAARPTVRIDVVDGAPARQAGLGQLLERSGFVATPRGLLLSRA